MIFPSISRHQSERSQIQAKQPTFSRKRQIRQLFEAEIITDSIGVHNLEKDVIIECYEIV